MNRGWSPKCIKNKKVRINPKYNDDMCVKYTVTAALNDKKLESIEKE